MNDSDALKLSSSHPSWEWKPVVSMRPPTTLSWSVTWTSVRTCTPTLFSLEVPPCTQVLLIGCRRRSPPLLPQQWRSRSLLPLRGNTPYGSEDQFWPLFPPSSRCGSQNRSTMSLVHPLCTGSASKQTDYVILWQTCLKKLAIESNSPRTRCLIWLSIAEYLL